MSQTRSLLSATFCTGLDKLVYQYFTGGSSEFYDGQYGAWEICERITDDDGLYLALIGSCYGGWLSQVIMLIAHSAEMCDDTFEYACMGGDMRIIAFVLSSGKLYNWDAGLGRAIEFGYKDVAELMIGLGASSDAGLYGACYHGRLEMIDLLITYGASNWDNGLLGACDGGEVAAAQIMIARGATPDARARKLLGMPSE